MLVCEEGETGVPGENLSVQSREPTNSTHIWRRVWASSPGHIKGLIRSHRIVWTNVLTNVERAECGK